MRGLRIEPSTLVMRDRLVLAFLTVIPSAILPVAMVLQCAFADIPCPLCGVALLLALVLRRMLFGGPRPLA